MMKRLLKISAILAMGLITCCSVMAQSAPRKPGLWSVTTTMTRQGMPGVPGPAGTAATSTTHIEVCATQAEFDKYGTFKPRTDGSCRLNNTVKHPGSMTAELVCDGKMKGSGTINALWTDAEHSKSTAHFSGTIQVGNAPR